MVAVVVIVVEDDVPASPDIAISSSHASHTAPHPSTFYAVRQRPPCSSATHSPVVLVVPRVDRR